MPDWGAISQGRPIAAPPADPTQSTIWGGAQRQPTANPADEAVTAPEPTGVGTLFTGPNANEGSGMGWGTALVGGGLLAAGAALHNPSGALGLLKRVGSIANEARYTSMLSGLAPLKSMLGNIGAPLIEAAESGNTDAMEAFASKQTMKDWWAAMKDPTIATGQGIQPAGSGPNSSLLSLPGRIMGAGDWATRQALQRGGLSANEAARSTLQLPLNQSYGKMAQALDSPAAELLIPFRRTPFNQFYEGLRTLQPQWPHKAVTAGAVAAGAASGALTKDESYPTFPALVTSLMGRYGLPAALGAAMARFMLGKQGGGIAGSILPVSEYGFEETMKNPLRPLEPSYWGITRAYKRVGEGR